MGRGGSWRRVVEEGVKRGAAVEGWGIRDGVWRWRWKRRGRLPGAEGTAGEWKRQSARAAGKIRQP